MAILPAQNQDDPATGSWRSTGNLNEPHAEDTATLLSNGEGVLVSGGLITAGILPARKCMDLPAGAGDNRHHTGRAAHTATLLPNGRRTGGRGSNNSGYLTSAEV